MRTLLAAFGLLGLLTGVAVADDETTEPTEATEEPTEPTESTEPADCSTLEGDAKTACEAAQKTEDGAKSKGKGGLKKSENNNMEQYVEEDE